jgi:UDP-2,3-diacylglucosamine pyrophosphatase LpxH
MTPATLAAVPRRYRTVWISDVHLGTRACRATALLDFLRRTECDTLYLVGDVIDGWALRRSWYWPQAHNDVVQKLLRKARKGTRVVYVPGNHDEFARQFAGHRFGGVEVLEEAMHETADGRRLWVLHGDAFDLLVRDHRLLVKLGDWAYAGVQVVHRIQAWARRRLGLAPWSLAAYVKARAKAAMDALCRFEESLALEARRRGAQGVVCGHTHHAEMRERDGVLYVNDGDWVDSCTSLVEHEDGRLEILRWPSEGPAEDDAGPADDALLGPEEAARVPMPTGWSSPAASRVSHVRRLSARVGRG